MLIKRPGLCCVTVAMQYSILVGIKIDSGEIGERFLSLARVLGFGHSVEVWKHGMRLFSRALVMGGSVFLTALTLPN